MALEDSLSLIDTVNQRIKRVRKRIDTLARQDKRAALLMSMPGIGHYSAMLILSRSAISPGSQHLSSSALW